MTKREEKRAWWREQVEAQQSSGLSVMKFSKEKGLKYAALLRWCREFSSVESEGGFQELKDSGNEFDLSCGRFRVTVPADLGEMQLAKIISALNRAASCLA